MGLASPRPSLRGCGVARCDMREPLDPAASRTSGGQPRAWLPECALAPGHERRFAFRVFFLRVYFVFRVSNFVFPLRYTPPMPRILIDLFHHMPPGHKVGPHIA